MFFPKTRMLQSSEDDLDQHLKRTGKKSLNPCLDVLIFLLVYVIGSVLQSILLSPFLVHFLVQKGAFPQPGENTPFNYNGIVKAITDIMEELPEWMMIPQLFATAITIVACVFYCRLFEKRGLVALGFSKKGAISEYLSGLGIGLALFGSTVVMALATGHLSLSLNAAPAWDMIILYFPGFLVQGFSEEVLCRSYLMVTLARKWPLPVAIFMNTAIFMLMHMSNPGLNLLAMVNIMLFGTFASLYTLRRGSIWGIAAIHGIWNFAQGNIFGISVSGISGSPSILQTTLSENGSFIHGGAFGMEGGFAVTIVLILGCIALIMGSTKKSEIAPLAI